VVRVVVVPSPRFPKVLAPQHFTVWSERSAQAWEVPNSTATAVVTEVVVVGEILVVVVPSPICP
jgi:hypothetical protein